MKKKKTIDREVIKAVHDDKFVQFLKSLEVYDFVIEGKAKCKFCGEVTTLDNIYTVFTESGTIKFACDSPACLAKMNSYLTNK
ncbi:hypothetical protein [Odoribacter laneus]|uniref:hypothetical protein n=1 Tax=Odoribacter laneus TaxID=626933 RepID=UPI00033DB8AD|nr:hypothetical protein [Odoribacter laneus]CCZ82242.1 unknown [Odoribacter laneus CAG:561]